MDKKTVQLSVKSKRKDDGSIKSKDIGSSLNSKDRVYQYYKTSSI